MSEASNSNHEETGELPLNAIPNNLFDFSYQRRPSISKGDFNSPFYIIFALSMCCILLALVSGTSIEQARILSMDEGETRMITNFSPLLASQLIISHHTPSIKVFHILTRPELEMEKELFIDNKYIILTSDDSSVQSHFLNSRSEISIVFTSQNEVSLFIFDGTPNYKSWKESITPGTWIKLIKSSKNVTCELKYVIPHSNVYYIVFKNNDELLDSIIDYKITIKRTEYVLDAKVPLCQEFLPRCIVDLSVHENGHIFIQSLRFYSNHQSNSSSTHPFTDVIIEGEPRWNYIFLFFIVFPITTIFIFYGIYLYVSKQNISSYHSWQQDEVSKTERMGLLNKHSFIESPDRVGKRNADSPIGFQTTVAGSTPGKTSPPVIFKPKPLYNSDLAEFS